MSIFDSKCKFYKHCSLYQINGYHCNETGGSYDITPFEFRPVGCYRLFKEHGKECKYYIKKQIR
jgi:hypothetical protein